MSLILSLACSLAVSVVQILSSREPELISRKYIRSSTPHTHVGIVQIPFRISQLLSTVSLCSAGGMAPNSPVAQRNFGDVFVIPTCQRTCANTFIIIYSYMDISYTTSMRVYGTPYYTPCELGEASGEAHGTMVWSGDDAAQNVSH